MPLRNLRRNKRGVETVIATLLMVVIVTIASVMVFAYSTGLLGALLVAPKTANESLSLEFTSFSPNNNNATIYLRNTGSSTVTLVSYYVKDGYGNQYSKVSGWTGGSTIPPTTLGTATVQISSACTCSTTGTPFTFQPGNAYTITLVSSRNGVFSFSVVR